MTKVKDILARVNSCPSQNTRVTEFFRSLLDVGNITDSILQESYEHVRERYLVLGGDDKVAKGTALLEILKKDLQNKFATGKKKHKQAHA